MARHGTVFFTDAICGTWSGAESVMPRRPELPPPPSGPGSWFNHPTDGPDQSMIIPLDLHESPGSTQQTVTDAGWNWIRLSPANAVEDEVLPPVGSPYQIVYPNEGSEWAGYAVSAGQLVAKDIIMCKYVYAGDDDTLL